MIKKYLSKTPAQTRKLGKRLALKILNKKAARKALVLGLEGDLGSGKTTFLQGFAKGLGIKEKILSPTFVIIKKFKSNPSGNPPARAGRPEGVQKKLKFKNFYHIDCYRLQKPKELLNLGFKEIILNPENIVAIEWADKIKKIMPKDIFLLKFKLIDKGKRQISFNINCF